MSRAIEEINRISDAKTSIRNAIINKGVNVPAETKIDSYAQYVSAIPTDVGNVTDEQILSLTTSGAINLPLSVTSIGQYSFWSRQSLTSVSAPGVITVNKYAFTSSYVQSVSLPACKVIYDHAFDGSRIQSISLPSIEVISAMQPFTSCNYLTSVDFGPNLHLIDETPDGHSLASIFGTPTQSLTTVIFRSTIPPAISSRTVLFNTNSTSWWCTIYVPAESVNAYKTATGWSYFADIIQAIPT